ncbi:MAG TPA: TraR/DksA family transcriptional regulator [Vicinamibacteria bacterium]|nr:TraR/DksA family transcriptional regulator [Vicinamibacteria bacterium]
MDQKKLKAFRERLLLKKREILEAFRKNKNDGMEADGEATQDIADKAANSYTKEFLFSLSSTERDLLQMVDQALLRIDERRFGVCAVCEEEMNLKRLEAVPWARLCLSCQQKQESGQL